MPEGARIYGAGGTEIFPATEGDFAGDYVLSEEDADNFFFLPPLHWSDVSAEYLWDGIPIPSKALSHIFVFYFSFRERLIFLFTFKSQILLTPPRMCLQRIIIRKYFVDD